MAYQLAERIDRLPMTRRHWFWLFMAALAWLLESYDIGLVGVVLVPFKSLWRMTPSETGLLVASATVGIVLGVVPAGYLADRFGRKRVLVASLLFYSLITAMTGLVSGWQALVGMRFVAGLGLGAMFPLPYTLLAELSPRRMRGAVAGVLDAFLSVGYFAAPLMGAWAFAQFGPAVGWRVLFAAAGLGIGYAVLLMLAMPESPRWLEAHGRGGEADRVVRRLEVIAHAQDWPLAERAGEDADQPRSPSRPVRAVWSKAYRRRTIMLWIAFPSVFFVFYAIMSYMPLVLHLEHLPGPWVLDLTALIMAASIPGKLVEAWLVERIGRKPVIVGFTAIAAIAAAVFPWVHDAAWIVGVAMVMAFFGISVDPAMKIFTAEQYPTDIRATGVGMTEGIGRLLGGALAPYIMALMLAAAGIRGSFLFVAAVAACGAGSVAWLGRETRGQGLEERVVEAEAEPEPAA
ncbi:MAG: MFS transporter [Thermaerobacter sp.]|nr:MFS transporter [Thermaerobacter sp.]